MRLATAALLVLLPALTAAEPVGLRTTPIEDFTLSGRDANQHGRLEFMGGLDINGPRAFGGLSGLLVEGDRLLAASDTGQWFTARLLLEGERLTGLADTALTPRVDVNGADARSKRRGDAEALTRSGDTLFVAIEAAKELISYPFAGGVVAQDARPTVVPLPANLARTARRGGLEALATLPNGDVAVFTEGHRHREDIAGAIHPSGATFMVKRAGSFAVTGASALPGGDVILAERRYDGGLNLGLRVRRIGADRFQNRAPLLDGPVLLETDLRAEIDNIEGIAAEVRDGSIIITLVSDDNFNIFQRTLLLRFRVTDPLPRPNPRRALRTQT